MSIPPDVLVPEVRGVVDDLQRRGYVLRDDRYDEASFGNALMVLERGALLVRLVRERGQWFIDAAPRNANDWFAPAVWHGALVAPIAASESLTFARQAKILLGDLDEVETASAGDVGLVLDRLRVVREDRARARREMRPPGPAT